MKVSVITLYEGHYHYGVASLINSLIACGFSGSIIIHYKGALPSWTRGFTQTDKNTFQFHGCSLVFKESDVLRHFGYHKPFVACEELAADPDCDAIIYADPDVLFLAPWSFFDEWLSMGVGLCLDQNFPYVPANHPWRNTWKGLLDRATGSTSNETTLYANSGFFSLTRTDIDFLNKWVAITLKFEEEGGNTKSFDLGNRNKAIVGDQDLLAATLMGWEGRTSILGQEAMGFTGHHFILSHDIGAPKSWKKHFVRESLRGIPPSITDALYLKHANAPISPYSPLQMLLKRLTFKLAKLISRVWTR